MLEAGRVADAELTAGKLIAEFGSLPNVIHASATRVRRIAGDDALRTIRILRSIMGHALRTRLRERPVFDNWRAVTDYARAELAGQMTEQARILYLDGRNQLISEKIQEGTVDTAPLYPREIVRGALEAGASALILIHNHPSGDPTPTSADISVTRAVVEAAKVFDISVHDHLIVGRGEVFSMKGRGLL